MMKRRVRSILVFLLPGVIINVAVAWSEPYVFGEKHQIVWGDGTSTSEWELYSERGWPLASLTTDRHEPGTTYFMKGDADVPVIPLWPGFAINTIFYAGVCWLLFAAPFAVRRRRRIKRGLCPACAYPVGTSNLCTECGKPVRSTLAEETT